MLLGITGLMRRHAPLMAVGALGVLGGMAIRLPFFPYVLPEATANVLGAAVGAIFAVWGAAWLADRKEQHAHALAAQAIRTTVETACKRARAIEAGLERIIALHKEGVAREQRIEGVREVVTTAQTIPLVMETLGQRLAFMEPLFLQLGGHGVIAHGTLIGTGPALNAAVARIPWAEFYEDPGPVERVLAELRAINNAVIDNAGLALSLLAVSTKGHLQLPDPTQ